MLHCPIYLGRTCGAAPHSFWLPAHAAPLFHPRAFARPASRPASRPQPPRLGGLPAGQPPPAAAAPPAPPDHPLPRAITRVAAACSAALGWFESRLFPNCQARGGIQSRTGTEATVGGHGVVHRAANPLPRQLECPRSNGEPCGPLRPTTPSLGAQVPPSPSPQAPPAQ
eukprot:gene9739-biopygen6219